METCFINSPLGITKIVGDDNGISAISILEEGIISAVIPSVFKKQLYNFKTISKIKEGSLLSKLIQKEPIFNKKFGRNYFIFPTEPLFLI